MNKIELTAVLQVCIFSFDGATKQEILDLNDNYSESIIRAGINLANHLKKM